MIISIMKSRFKILLLITLLVFSITSCGENGQETEQMLLSNEGTFDNQLPIDDKANKDIIQKSTDIQDKNKNNDIETGDDKVDSFYIKEIDDEIFARINGKSYKENCTVPVDDLRYLHVLHKTIEGTTSEGELIVNAEIAQTVLDIFKNLYEADYPIESIRLVDEFDADDEKSMSANNSSAFNYRTISYSNKLSNHSYGKAIDINPRYNPYVKTVNDRLSIEPANGADYVDREKDFDYKIDENDLAYILFTEAGFEWGGSWNHSKDYQHFEMP